MGSAQSTPYECWAEMQSGGKTRVTEEMRSHYNNELYGDKEHSQWRENLVQYSISSSMSTIHKGFLWNFVTEKRKGNTALYSLPPSWKFIT